ncbi:hypothetical protein V2O64_20345 [Verrucomicrobiaceae bacterium 227]
MNKTKTTLKLALLGTSLAAFAALTSCCGSAPDPAPQPAPPMYGAPAK